MAKKSLKDKVGYIYVKFESGIQPDMEFLDEDLSVSPNNPYLNWVMENRNTSDILKIEYPAELAAAISNKLEERSNSNIFFGKCNLREFDYKGMVDKLDKIAAELLARDWDKEMWASGKWEEWTGFYETRDVDEEVIEWADLMEKVANDEKLQALVGYIPWSLDDFKKSEFEYADKDKTAELNARSDDEWRKAYYEDLVEDVPLQEFVCAVTELDDKKRKKLLEGTGLTTLRDRDDPFGAYDLARETVVNSGEYWWITDAEVVDISETEEYQYNESIDEADLNEPIEIDPTELNVLTYAKPNDECDGIEIHLGNQAAGFPFTLQGVTFNVEVPLKENGKPQFFALQGQEWKCLEHLYLCGEWSWEGEDAVAIQTDICTATSGYAAHRYKKSKYAKQVRKDYNDFRLDWMLWCVWQKCKGSEKFAQHLLSMPDDRVIIEVVKRDPVWAAWPDENGIYRGNNAMGKILTICRRCLKDGTEPKIDTDKLNAANIWILGTKLKF